MVLRGLKTGLTAATATTSAAERLTRRGAIQCGTNEELVNGVCKCKSGYTKNNKGQCVLINTGKNTAVTTPAGAGSQNNNQSKTNENRTTLACDKIQRLTYIQLEGLIRDNKVDFECKEYPCDGLTSEQQKFLKENGWTLLKCPEDEQDTPNPKEEPSDPYDTTGLCGEGLTWDSDKKGCVPVTVCGPNTTLNDKGQCVSTVPEIDCPDGYYQQGGQCRSRCGSGRYWNVSSRTCLPIPNCPEGYNLNQATGKCEPQCRDTEYYDEDADQCRPRRTCGNGTKANAYNQCVPQCKNGQYYDSRTGKCVPSPTCSQEAGTTLDPKTNQCVSICQPGKEYWNGKNCEPIPSCGKGTRFNQQSGQCEPAFDKVECGPGTTEIDGQCMPIETEPPPPPPPPVDITVNLPPDSGNVIIEDPDPDNSTPTEVSLTSRGCEDLPPPPPPPPPADNTTPIKLDIPKGKHLYVLQNKVGDENTYINAPYGAEGVDDEIRGLTGYFWYFDDRIQAKPLLPVYREVTSGNIRTQRGLTRYFDFKNAIEWQNNNQTNIFNLKDVGNSIVLEKILSFKEVARRQQYKDHVFYANIAKNGKQIQNSNLQEPYTYESESRYNYYINSYEKLLESANSPQVYELPNFYFLDQTSQNSQDSSLKNQFYDNYVSDIINEQIELTEEQKNIIFITNDVQINTVDDKYVPFYNRINFRLEKDKRKIYDYFNNVSNGWGARTSFLNSLILSICLKEKDLFSTKNYSYRNNESGKSLENVELFSIPFLELYSAIVDLQNNKLFYEREIRKAKVVNPGSLRYYEHKKFKNIFNSAEYYLQNINTLLKEKRSFLDVINGKEGYSETLLYKIEKYEEGIEEPVQNIWLTNDEKDVFDYIDTQVKYNTEYTYVVKSYRYVVGNNYRYDQIEQKRNNLFEVRCRNSFEPNIIVTEYARISGIVIDKPPPAPEIDVIPYKDNSEKVLVLFNPSTVQYRRKPVAFTDSESEFYERILRYQNSQDEKITFGGDDKTTKYLVYRIEHHPSSYEDFYNALYAEIDTECNCTTAEYVQDLEANKKYYYVFRSVDVHGHLSYPTQPFLVELINEAGTTFLDFRGVDFIDKDYKSLTKPVKRFIHIKPNLEQSMLKVEENNLNSAKTAIEEQKYDLGQEELTKSVWGENFKLKIKSKNTNKEINIKFKFVKKENTDLIRNLEESCE